jgi:hypothetical protein
MKRSLPALAAGLLAASLAVAGCSADSNSADTSAARAGAAGAAAPEAGPNAADGKQASGSSGSGTSTRTTDIARSQSYIVRTATLTVEAKNVPDALAQARTLVTGAGGYVGDESTSLDAKGQEHSRLQLRVPQDRYDGVLSDLAGLGKLVDRKAQAQDVTSEVVDVESRVKSQRASVARVRELMNRATKLTDVVTLEGELGSRQADLEALEAQQASLKDRTGMATVTLILREPDAVPAAKEDAGVWGSVADALGAGWHAFYVTFRAILIALAAVLPFAALGLLGWVVYRALRRRTPALPTVPDPDST